MSDAQQADTPLSQKVQDLDRQISAKVESLVRGVHAQIGERVRAATDDVVRWIEENAPELPQSLVAESDLTDWLGPLIAAKAEPDVKATTGYRPLLEAISRIDKETGQADILGGLLEESLRFCSRSAFFLIRQGQVRGWAGTGFGASDARIGQIEEKADLDPWSEIVELSSSIVCSDEQLAGMAIRFSASPGEKAVLVPFAIRGQIAGLLYSDEVQGGNPISVSGLQLLVHAAAGALETATVSPGLSPCLRLQGGVPEPAVGSEEESVAAETVPADPATIDDIAEPVGLMEPLDEVAVEDVVAPAVEEQASADPLYVESGTEGLSTEDLETTVVPAVGDDAETVLEASGVAAAEVEIDEVDIDPVLAEPVSEPTVEIDAPALDLGIPRATAPEAPAFSGVPAAPEVSATEVSAPEVSVPVVEESGFGSVSEPASAAPEPPAFDDLSPSLEPEVDPPGFESVSPPSEEEIALETEPEPELEDSNAWQLEEEEDDEPTQVGMAVKLDTEPEEDSPPAFEVSASEPVAPVAPPAPDLAPNMPVGQETVRLPIVAPPNDPGDETSPSLQIAAPVAPSFAEPPSAPAAPPAPTSFADPVPPVVPAAPSSFADPLPSPSSFADPPPSPSSFADPPPPVPAAPTSFVEPPPVTAGTSGGFAPPVEKSAEVRPSGGSQVQPPVDLEGPGLAFATPTATPEQTDLASEALHEEARRLARLLVSEIKLYNEEIIEEGRRTGNIYERLKDDIDRSRQMYEERIDPRLADQEDYFFQELVQRLAGGDQSLLGM